MSSLEQSEPTMSDITTEPRPVSAMSEREMLEEIVMTMRMVSQALNAFSTSGAGQMMARMLTRK